MTRTYLDSGVLIAAARGSANLHATALEIVRDPDREFVCSDYVRLEVSPKATYYGYTEEADFYAAFYSEAETGMEFDADHLRLAFDEACNSGLSAFDAVHVIAAAQSGCDELLTTEKPNAPIHRTELVRTVSLAGDPLE